MHGWLRELAKIEPVRDSVGFESIHFTVETLNRVGFYPRFSTITDGVNEPECLIDDRQYISFCANNYLSLSEDSRVKQAAMDAIAKYGIGPGGSRVIAGNVDIIEQLEDEIADLTGTEACLTFPTGYMANVTVFQALMDPYLGRLPYKKGSGTIFLDEFNHGSVLDGVRLSTAKVVTFKHNDLRDLERRLAESDSDNKLVVIEGVYSLEGRIADIPAYIRTVRKYGAKLMVDDAHGIGIIGSRGGGVGEYFDCADEIDLLMGCMDKAMGGTGGYVCGKKPLVDFLRIAARSSLLSSAIPCGMAGGVIEAIRIIKEGSAQRAELFQKAAYLKSRLIKGGLTVLGDQLLPSVPLFIGDDAKGYEFAERLYNRGIFLPVVRWPALAPGKSRFRIILMSRHEWRHLDRLADACIEIDRELTLQAETPTVQKRPMAV